MVDAVFKLTVDSGYLENQNTFSFVLKPDTRHNSGNNTGAQ